MQEHSHEGCNIVGPPRRAPCSRKRRKNNKKNRKDNRTLHGVRHAAYQTLTYQSAASPQALMTHEHASRGISSDVCPVDSIFGPANIWNEPHGVNKKRTRRGGKAAKRQKFSNGG